MITDRNHTFHKKRTNTMKISSVLRTFFIILLSTQAVHTSEKWIPLSFFSQYSCMQTHAWKLPSFNTLNSQDVAVYTTIAVASAATLYGMYRWMQPAKKPLNNTPKVSNSSSQTVKNKQLKILNAHTLNATTQTEYSYQDVATLQKQNADLIRQNKQLHDLVTHATSQLLKKTKVIATQQEIIKMQEKALGFENTTKSFDTIYANLPEQK